MSFYISKGQAKSVKELVKLLNKVLEKNNGDDIELGYLYPSYGRTQMDYTPVSLYLDDIDDKKALRVEVYQS